MEHGFVLSILAIILNSKIFVTGKQIFVSKGETVTLPCTQYGNAPPSWTGPANEGPYTSGEELNPQLDNFNRLTLTINETIGSFDLQIQNFSYEDEGHYLCASVFSDESVLKVENISVFIRNNPTVHITQRPTINVTEGNDLSLYCNVTSNYQNTIVRWTRMKNKGINIVRSSLSNNEYYISNNVKRTDAGVYTCIATSSAGAAEDNITVEVQYAPDISFQYLKLGRVLRCFPNGVPHQYTFYKWEHKSEFGDHIRYITDDGNGQINISSDLNETYRHHDRGIYVCRVSNGVSANGKRVQSGEYRVTPEAKPYFTTFNSPKQYGVLGQKGNIKMYVVSVPKVSNVLVFNPDFSVDAVDFGELDITRIKDTMYGKTVSVEGYIMSIPVTTSAEFQTYTIEVSNSIGSSNYTVHFKSAGEQSSSTDLVVCIVSILGVGLIFALFGILYYRWKKVLVLVCNNRPIMITMTTLIL